MKKILGKRSRSSRIKKTNESLKTLQKQREIRGLNRRRPQRNMLSSRLLSCKL